MTGQQHNGSNLGMYSGANNLDQDQDQKKNASPDFDNIGEDLIMMNIPREGNADQLNKSTKLTLSSKK